MATLRDWLVFSRTHTAALTIPGVLLAAYLADPTQGWLRFTLFGVFAFCAHGSGFAVNNLFDLVFDIRDPSKKDHPLVAGRIMMREAWFAVILAMSLTFYLGAYLSRSWTGTTLLLSFIIFGTIYNYVCKKSLTGPIWISLSFASLPAYAWYASGGHYSITLSYIVAYSFLLMLAQISISGWGKDLCQEGEVNLLRTLGATAIPTSPGVYEYHFPWSTKLLAGVLRAAMAGLAVGYAYGTNGPIILTISLAALAYLTLLVVVDSGTWLRKRKVLFMGLSEIFAYWALVSSLATLLGPILTAAFILGPIVYYMFLNKFFWNTWAAPAV